MRKIPLALLLAFLSLSAYSFAATISLPDKNVDEGASVEIPVTVDDAKGITGFQFTVTYDTEALEASGADAGDVTSGWMITANTYDTGEMKVTGLDTSLSGLQSISGSLVNLQFKVIGKPGKKCNLAFTVCKLSDSAGNKISSICKDGNIKIKTSGKGKTKPQR